MLVEHKKLIDNVKVVGELLKNKVIAMDDSYLKVLTMDGQFWLAGFGSYHTILMKLQDILVGGNDNISVNVEYNKFWDIVSLMQEEVKIEIKESGLLLEDSNVSTELVNVMADNNDLEDVKRIISERDEILEEGIDVGLEEFYEALKYLRSVQERDDRMDLETGIMFTKQASYVVGDLFAVKYDYKLPFDLILDNHTTKTLLEMLSVSDSETFTIIRKNGFTWFNVDGNIYVVNGLAGEVEGIYQEVFNHRRTNDFIEMDRKECVRLLSINKVLSDEPDIHFKIEEGKGQIFTKNSDGDGVEGVFYADECQDVHFTVSVDDMLNVVSRLPKDIDDNLQFQVVIVPEEHRFEEQNILHLEHEKGDCIFSINTDIEL